METPDDYDVDVRQEKKLCLYALMERGKGVEDNGQFQGSIMILAGRDRYQ